MEGYNVLDGGLHVVQAVGGYSDAHKTAIVDVCIRSYISVCMYCNNKNQEYSMLLLNWRWYKHG